jgi:hypothetical protein
VFIALSKSPKGISAPALHATQSLSLPVCVYFQPSVLLLGSRARETSEWLKGNVCTRTSRMSRSFVAQAINYCMSTIQIAMRVPGYITESYCDSCEVRTEFIYVM